MAKNAYYVIMCTLVIGGLVASGSAQEEAPAPAPAEAAPAEGGGIKICEADPELKELAASNPQVAQCCTQYDALLGDLKGTLEQGFTALVPVLGCLQLPPGELSATCYNDMLSTGANCFNEMNVLLGFFNDTGLLDTVYSFANGSNTNVEEAKSAIPPPDKLMQMGDDYLPTAQANLKAITGSETINPVCCQSIAKNIEDQCPCEQKAMSFLTSRLKLAGINLADYVPVAKKFVNNLGCNGADNLQVYPDCVKE